MIFVAALLLQLTLWAATVHAFFPFIPPGQCDPNEPCGASVSARRRDGPRGTAEGVTVDLYHRPSGADGDSANGNPVAAAATRSARKYGRYQPSRASELGKRKNTYSISQPATPTTSNSAGIYQYGPDYSYFIKVQVGSAQQPFYMLLDTGASNTWLMGSDCKSDACLIHDVFDPSSSKSWKTDKKGFSIEYGSGDLTGIVGQDTATFAGLTMDLSFGLANYTHDDFKHFAFDGILGLTMGPSVTGTFLQTLKSKKLISSLIVSMSLNRDSDGVNDGQVTFGGVDKSKYTGEISYTDVQSPHKEQGEWAIKMDGVSFNGTSAGVSSKLTYIDTGTSFVFAPPADLAALFKLVPGSSSSKNGDYVEYQVPCDTKLPIKLTFGGVSYDISARDWVGQQGDKCISNLYGYEVFEGAWLVGDTFLKNVYSVFDADKMRVGLASKPAPPPKPTGTALGAGSATTLPAAVTSLASDDSAHPMLPGLSGQETQTATAGSAQSTSAGAAHTQVNSGSQLGGGLSVSALCVAAAVAMLG